jgi:hypothetical protein
VHEDALRRLVAFGSFGMIAARRKEPVIDICRLGRRDLLRDERADRFHRAEVDRAAPVMLGAECAAKTQEIRFDRQETRHVRLF